MATSVIPHRNAPSRSWSGSPPAAAEAAASGASGAAAKQRREQLVEEVTHLADHPTAGGERVGGRRGLMRLANATGAAMSGVALAARPLPVVSKANASAVVTAIRLVMTGYLLCHVAAVVVMSFIKNSGSRDRLAVDLVLILVVFVGSSAGPMRLAGVLVGLLLGDRKPAGSVVGLRRG